VLVFIKSEHRSLLDDGDINVKLKCCGIYPISINSRTKLL